MINSNQSIEETVSDTIDDNNLVDTYFNFDNFNFENCGQNTFSTATTLNKNEIGILKYENKSNYTVKIAITSMTNKSIDKFITVSPKSISVIKYGLKNNDDNTICSIVFHCAEENLNGLFTSGTARIKSKN